MDTNDRSHLLQPFYVTTAFGTRTWQAEDAEHAREQHENAFGEQPDETILCITGAIHNV
jgi:hypothetical protein